jgi:hypothetical protein
VPDFHGGAENFRSVDYMAIPYPVMQTLGTMIIDGVFERFPRLMCGVIEQGASWLPGWMRSLDSALEAFRKNEERLRALSLRPSEYVRRQIRVTPTLRTSADACFHQTQVPVLVRPPHRRAQSNRDQAALAAPGDQAAFLASGQRW